MIDRDPEILFKANRLIGSCVMVDTTEDEYQRIRQEILSWPDYEVIIRYRELEIFWEFMNPKLGKSWN